MRLWSQTMSFTKLTNCIIMKHKKCRFQKGRDIMDVVADCCPNITDAIEKGYIEEANIPSQFNQIEAIEDVGSVAQDIFDMVTYQNQVKFLRGEARKKAEKV